MELDNSWIEEYELKEKDFEKFYKEPVETVEIIFLYINKEGELEKIKKTHFLLETDNKIDRDELISIIKENIVDNKIKYSLLSILKHNIDLDPNDLGKYLTKDDTEETLKENEYLQVISDISDLHFKDSITLFRDLDSVFIVFYETTKKLKKSLTKKIYLSSKTRKTSKEKHLNRDNVMYISYNMSALITALDKQSNVQTGENGHSEIGWSKSIDNDSIREKITQFYFQLVRSKEKFDIRNDKIAIVLDELLTSTKIVSSSDTNVELSADYQFKKDMVITLYKILAQTRDIISGKGEYQLAYTQLIVWWKHYPALAKYALHMFVNSADSNDHPYGSWKDIKFFCDYCVKRCGINEDHTFIEYCSFIMMKQLQKDMKQREESSDNNISLAARWAPRESSKKYGWLARKISEKYFENYIETAKTDAKMRAAKEKR